MATVWSLEDGPFTYFGPVGWRQTPVPDSQITAEQYLDFARRDFASGHEQGLINAMGNSKRAFHLMVDTLLGAYGLLAQNKRCHFVQKLELLDKCELISLRILRRLNSERNAMEHEYRAPEADDVSDAIDVCQLLLLAMERLCETALNMGTAGHRESGKHVLVELDPERGTITGTELLDPVVVPVESFGFGVVFPLVQNGSLKPEQGEPDSKPLFSVNLDIRTTHEWLPYWRAMRGARKATP
jgi:hypothetical protein